jgi:hypothetical protein
MDDKVRREFLRKMGMPEGSGTATKEKEKGSSEKRRDNRFDKSALLTLAQKFDVAPTPKKPQTFEEYLKEKGE